MKKFSVKLWMSLVVGAVGLAGCLKDGDDTPPIPAGVVTFVNAFSDAAAVSYRIDGQTLGSNGGSSFDFKTFSVGRLRAGNRRLEIFAQNRSNGLLDSTIVVKDSTGYSTFIYGTAAAPRFAMVQDETIENLGEKTGLRFLHLANGVAEVSVFLGDEGTASFAGRPLETGASAEANRTFTAKESGSFALFAKDADGKELAKRNYEFLKGHYYTIMLIGTDGHSERPLYLGVIAH